MVVISTITRGGHPGKKKHGTKRTGHTSAHHHHHENKSDISEERNRQAFVRGKVKTTSEVLPEIKTLLSNDDISATIKEVTGEFEDAFQDAWVKVLETQPTTLDEVRESAKQCSHANASRVVEDRYKTRSIDAPLTDGDDALTLLDVIPHKDIQSDIELDVNVNNDRYVATATGKINRKGHVILDEDMVLSLQKQFPHDTLNVAVRKMLQLPPIERNKKGWYKWEDAIIRQRYPWGGARACALDITRSLPVINSRAQLLGVKAGNKLNSYKPVADWLNIPEVAEMLDCSWMRINRLIKNGDIASIVIPKYHQGHDGIFVTQEAITNYREGIDTKVVSVRKQIQEAVKQARLDECKRLSDKKKRLDNYRYRVQRLKALKVEEIEKLKVAKVEEIEKLKALKVEEIRCLRREREVTDREYRQAKKHGLEEFRKVRYSELREVIGNYNKNLKAQVEIVKSDCKHQVHLFLEQENVKVHRIRASYNLLSDELYAIMQEAKPYRVAFGCISLDAKYLNPIKTKDKTHYVYPIKTGEWVEACHPQQLKMTEWMLKNGFKMRFVPGLPTCKKCLAIIKKKEGIAKENELPRM